MKEMIKRVREEKGGFTLAELLIVVAIILVLVAVAIPIFANVQNQANTAVAQGDIRSVTAAAAVQASAVDKVNTYPVYYSAKVDRHGNVTDLKKVEGTPAVTEESDITTWLNGTADTYTITVKLNAATTSTTTTTTP